MISFIEFRRVYERPYLEAAGDRYSGEMPIPPMVMGVLRNVPTGHNRAVYAAVLSWIFTKGLYIASAKRKRLTVDANDRNKHPELKGTKFHDFEMYSREAHDFYEEQGIPLRDFYIKTYLANPENYEPQAIDLINSTGIKIRLDQLNQRLKSEGVQVFRYGGYDGLIEYIETGRDDKGKQWADRKFAKDRFTNDNGDIIAYKDRLGHDVSGSLRHEDENGDNHYTFAGFKPPGTDRAWNRIVFNVMKHSDKQVEKARRAIERAQRGDEPDPADEVNIADVIEKGAFDKFVSNPKINKVGFTGAAENMSLPAKWGFANDINKIRDFLQEEQGAENFAIVSFLINLAVNKWLNERQTATPEVGLQPDVAQDVSVPQTEASHELDPEEMFRGKSPIFPSPGSMKINPRFYPNKTAHPNPILKYSGSKATIDPWIKRGGEIAQQIFADGGNDWKSLEDEIIAFTTGNTPMCKFMKWKPNVNVDSIKKSLEGVIEHGYLPTQELSVHAIPHDPDDYSHVSYVNRYKDSKYKEPLGDIKFFTNKGFRIFPSNAIIGEDGIPSDRDNFRLVDKANDIKLIVHKDENGRWMILNPPNDNQELGRQVGDTKREPLSAEKLDFFLKTGFRLNLPKDSPKLQSATGLDRLPPGIDKASLTNKKQNIKYKLVKQNGQWLYAKSHDTDSSFDDSSKAWFGSGQNMRINVGDKEEFAMSHSWGDIHNSIQEDPKGWGFGYGEPGNPNTYQDFLKKGAEWVRSALKRDSKLTDLQVYKNDNDLETLVAEQLPRFSSKNEFRLGDLDDPNISKYFKNLNLTNFSDDDINDLINDVKGWVRNGHSADYVRKELNSIPNFPKDLLFGAFAINGKMWRLKKSVPDAVAAVASERPEGTGDVLSPGGDSMSGGANSAGGAWTKDVDPDDDDEPEWGQKWDPAQNKMINFKIPSPLRDDERIRSGETSDRRAAQLAGSSAPVNVSSDVTPDEARAALVGDWKILKDKAAQMDAARSKNLILYHHPEIIYYFDNDVEKEHPHYITTPEDLKSVYNDLIKTNNHMAIMRIRQKASTYKPYADSLMIPSKDLRIASDPIASAPIAVRPNLTLSPKMSTAPVQPRATPPVIDNTGSNLMNRFNSRNVKKESAMFDFTKYKIIKMRRSLLERK